MSGGSVNVNGRVEAPGGKISLAGHLPDLTEAPVTLGARSSLDVSGDWVNDAPMLNNGTLAPVNGGSVEVRRRAISPSARCRDRRERRRVAAVGRSTRGRPWRRREPELRPRRQRHGLRPRWRGARAGVAGWRHAAPRSEQRAHRERFHAAGRLRRAAVEPVFLPARRLLVVRDRRQSHFAHGRRTRSSSRSRRIACSTPAMA